MLTTARAQNTPGVMNLIGSRLTGYRNDLWPCLNHPSFGSSLEVVIVIRNPYSHQGVRYEDNLIYPSHHQLIQHSERPKRDRKDTK